MLAHENSVLLTQRGGGFQPHEAVEGSAIPNQFSGGIRYAQFRKAVAEGVAREAEGAGGLTLVAVGTAEGFADGLLFPRDVPPGLVRPPPDLAFRGYTVGWK
jgi:hypothetical protein